MYRALIKKRIYERVTESHVVTLPMVLLGMNSGRARHNVTLRCHVAVTLPSRCQYIPFGLPARDDDATD